MGQEEVTGVYSRGKQRLEEERKKAEASPAKVANNLMQAVEVSGEAVAVAKKSLEEQIAKYRELIKSQESVETLAEFSKILDETASIVRQLNFQYQSLRADVAAVLNKADANADLERDVLTRLQNVLKDYNY